MLACVLAANKWLVSEIGDISMMNYPIHKNTFLRKLNYFYSLPLLIHYDSHLINSSYEQAVKQ